MSKHDSRARERETEEGAYIDLIFFVAHVKIVENGRFFQITEENHIIDTFHWTNVHGTKFCLDREVKFLEEMKRWLERGDHLRCIYFFIIVHENDLSGLGRDHTSTDLHIEFAAGALIDPHMVTLEEEENTIIQCQCVNENISAEFMESFSNLEEIIVNRYRWHDASIRSNSIETI